MALRRRLRVVPLLLVLLLVPLLLLTQLSTPPPPHIALHEAPVPGWPPSTPRLVALYTLPNTTTTLIAADHVCAVPLLLLVVVCSAVANADARLAVRETWASPEYVSQSARVVFFLGASAGQDVLEESLRYGDIVQEDFVDSYNNLTIKTVMMLKWFRTHCPNVEYIMKTDDDSVVNVNGLTRVLEAEKVDLMGRILSNIVPIRSPRSKWYMPSYMFPAAVYPAYLSGTGYVMSRQVAADLHAAAVRMSLLHLEDVFITGLVARRIGVRVREHRGFSFMTRDFAPCARLTDNIITSHKISPALMRRRWCLLGDTCTLQLTRTQSIIRGLLCLVDMLGFPPPEVDML